MTLNLSVLYKIDIPVYECILGAEYAESILNNNVTFELAQLVLLDDCQAEFSLAVFVMVSSVATPAERRGRKATGLQRDGRAATSVHEVCRCIIGSTDTP